MAEYLPLMATKYNLQIELVEMQWKLLPLKFYPLRTYQARLSQAIEDLKHRDSEDAHTLALARSLAVPIWSNDRDFQNVKVDCYSTARLLAST